MLVLLSPLLWPLVTPGFFRSDDGEWMVIRLVAFFDTLKTGQFPVRFLWNLNHGFGYPVTNFLYPLPFYAGSLFHLLGFGFIDSVKALFTLSFILSAFFMYKLAEKEGNRWGAIAAGLFYAYAPYRIFDVYNRGSLGESFAFIWPPLILYLINLKTRRSLVLASLTTAALICSHNVLALLFMPVIFGYWLLKNWKLGIGYWILAIGLSAWFWFPALYDLQYTRAGITQVADFSRYFLNLNLLGIFIPVILLLTIRFKNINFIRVVVIGSLFFALPVSTFFWQILPLPKLVQFPWRFLSVSVFASAVLLGSLIKNKFLFILFIMALILTTRISVDKIYYQDNYYVANDDTTTVKNEYMPRWVKSDPTGRPEKNSAVYFPGIKPENYDVNGIVTAERITFEETAPRLTADVVSLVSLIITGLLIL